MSEVGSMKRACAASAATARSSGRSRGSRIASAAATMMMSSRQPSSSACTIIRPSRGSTGSRARRLPTSVTRRASGSDPLPGRSAPTSSRIAIPAATARRSGGSRKGKSAISPRPSVAICRRTLARLVRRISGSVNAGRDPRSDSSYSRMQMPGPRRPHLPARCAALACEIGSMGRRCTLRRVEKRDMRT